MGDTIATEKFQEMPIMKHYMTRVYEQTSIKQNIRNP